MRFLGVTETCDLGALYLRLKAEGHEVRVAVSHPMAQGTLAGLVERSVDWVADLPWIKEAGADGIILFESVSAGFGALQDQLRAQGYNVVGGSAYGDRLENDRAYAQGVLAELGFPQGHVREFADPAQAHDFIAARPRRYVLKRSGAGHSAGDTYVGRLTDGRDVQAMLRAMPSASTDAASGDRPILLMDFIDGVEMGVGAYFNGVTFIRPASLDWEHKHFFAGDMGEMTGEMGTVFTYQDSEAFFARTLARMEGRLREAGHVGFVNLNTIVNAEGIWPLEFTCRFGYPAFAVLTPLQATPWGELLKAMCARAPQTLATLETLATHAGFSVGLVLTTPPFPYSREEVDEPVGLPVLIDADVDPRHVHHGEVGLDHTGGLVTSGLYGWTLVVTGVGADPAEAKAFAYKNAAKVFAPNLRYRLDIADRLIAHDLAAIRDLGLISSVTPTAVEEVTAC